MRIQGEAEGLGLVCCSGVTHWEHVLRHVINEDPLTTEHNADLQRLSPDGMSVHQRTNTQWTV